MRAVEVSADRALVAVEHPDPVPGPGQALIDVAYCGICGSDLHFRPIPELFPAGTIPGHELSGRIAALGPNVSGWSVGDRVVVLPFGQCGECETCRSGNEQVCAHAVADGVGLGTGRPGGYADRVIVDERMLFALPDELSDRDAALVEPLAVAVRAVNVASMPLDAPVAVIGGGAVGLLTALLLRERGYTRFSLVSRNPAREARATALGLPAVSPADFEAAAEQPPACVFECAGTPSAVRLAVELLQPLGKLILVGLSLEPLELPAPAIVLKEIVIRGVIAYRRAEFSESIELLARGAIPVDALVTATVPLEAAETSFRALTSPGNAHIKVLIQPSLRS